MGTLADHKAVPTLAISSLAAQAGALGAKAHSGKGEGRQAILGVCAASAYVQRLKGSKATLKGSRTESPMSWRGHYSLRSQGQPYSVLVGTEQDASSQP